MRFIIRAYAYCRLYDDVRQHFDRKVQSNDNDRGHCQDVGNYSILFSINCRKTIAFCFLLCYTDYAKLNESLFLQGLFIFIRIFISLYNTLSNLIKMQIPLGVLCKFVLAWIPFSLATIGVCVFCAFTLVGALFI